MSFVRANGSKFAANDLKGIRANVRVGSGRLTSSGITDLDDVLGGGMPLGSIVCMRELGGTAHTNAFLACYIAQGIAHDQAVAIAVADDHPENVVRSLPTRMHGGPGAEMRDVESAPGDSLDLRIAWRYRKSTVAPTSAAAAAAATKGCAPFCHSFDLSRADTQSVEKARISLLGFGQSTDLEDVYRQFCNHLRAAKRINVAVRFVVRLADSDLWQGDVTKFFRRTRALIRDANASCVCTVAGENPALEHLMDVSLVVDTHDGLGTKSLGLGDYLGTLHLRWSSTPFSIKPFPSAKKLHVFSRGRRRYHIEEAHAAPEEDELKSFEDGKTLACAPTPSGTNPAVEF